MMIIPTERLYELRGRVTMVSGGFDPIHQGHVAYFRAAADLGRPVLCNISHDGFVGTKHPPLLSQEQRALVIDGFRDIDYVHLERGTTAQVLSELHPRALVKGDDWSAGLPAGEEQACREHGVEIVFLDTVVDSSSRLLADFLRRREPANVTAHSPLGLPDPHGIDAVVTHHRNAFRSGVARFNEILADRLGVPLLNLFDGTFVSSRRPLLSFKVSEMSQQERAVLAAVLEGNRWNPEPFIHDWYGTDLEKHLVARAARVWCSNHQVLEQVEPLHHDVRLAFSPGLMLDHRRYQPAEITVFSFGMAHKIRTDMFRRLKLLLDKSTKSYAAYISAANHETASMGDTELVFGEMLKVFGPDRLYFLGNLSDVAIYNQLVSTTFFAAFFDGGVRANNTSVAAAMEHGAVVITNLDAQSPPEYRHMETVIDIEQATSLPSDLLTLRRLSLAAMQASDGQSWDRLVDLFRDPSAESATAS